MSTSINISNDLNNYLKSSGSSINGNGGNGGQSSSNGGSFMNGWFSGGSGGGGGASSKPSGADNKSWFSYQPLRTSSPDEDAASINSGSTNGQSGGGGWLRNPFGTKEPEPPGWFPTLVCPITLSLHSSNHRFPHHSLGHNESLDFSSSSSWASPASAW